MKNKKAFTLIELLVVIAIIGILATISALALSNARAKSRDAKRAGDIKQIQTALELFFNDNNRYPTIDEWNTGKIFSTSTGATSTYMQIIPTAPTPADGSCSDEQNYVSYVPASDGSSYSISFCLGNTTGTLTPGPKCLTPSGIMNSACDISFSPTNLSGLQLWLKADAGVTTDVDGYVSEWNDYSGNNNNANQVTGVSQPLLVEDVLNGKPALRFDGINDYLQLPNACLPVKDNTIYIVYNCTNSSDNDLLLSSFYGNVALAISPNLIGMYYILSDQQLTTASQEGHNYKDGSYYWAECFYDGTTSSINTSNGISFNSNVTSGNIVYNALNQASIGSYLSTGGNSGYYHQGDIAEIIIYNTALSSENRVKVETYLNTKYNLY